MYCLRSDTYLRNILRKLMMNRVSWHKPLWILWWPCMRYVMLLRAFHWAATEQIISDRPTTQKALFTNMTLLPSYSPLQSTVPMPDFEGQMRKERAATAQLPPSNWFKQALGGAGQDGCGVWPTEHAQWGGMPCDGNTVGSPICWGNVCTSRPEALFHPV